MSVNIPPTGRMTFELLTCAAATVSGEVVAGWTEAVEAARSVYTLMDTEAARLTERKQTTLIDI